MSDERTERSIEEVMGNAVALHYLRCSPLLSDEERIALVECMVYWAEKDAQCRSGK